MFLHKIAPGGTDKSYGIQSSPKRAGVPADVLEFAPREVLTELETHHVNAPLPHGARRPHSPAEIDAEEPICSAGRPRYCRRHAGRRS